MSAYVEAVFVEEGTDCSFRHIVTLREDENGNWIYLGNKVDRKDALQIPRYRARREYEEHSTVPIKSIKFSWLHPRKEFHR